jgi:hypothetical protein
MYNDISSPHCRGLATRMLRELMKAGSENGIRSMVAITTATNHAMQHLLKHNVDNVKILRDGSEVWRGLRLYLPPPPPGAAAAALAWPSSHSVTTACSFGIPSPFVQ